MPLTKFKLSSVANDGITSAKIKDGDVATVDIADQAVTLAKLEHGTSSNNGKFLRANNGADPTYEVVAVTPTAVSDQANTSTGGFSMPTGTTAQRPGSPDTGESRYNSTTGSLEYYDSTKWISTNLIPNISSITGEINDEVTSNLVFAVTNNTASVDIVFSEGGSAFHTITGQAVSAGAFTIATPSQVYGQTAGDTISISIKNEDGTPSGNAITKTVVDRPSGGTITTYGSYRVHTFTSSGTFNSGAKTAIDVLVVAGGGAGATGNKTNASSADAGSGGGGGGMVVDSNRSVAAATNFSIVVGAGGSASSTANTQGANGSNSSGFGITAIGGGGGGLPNANGSAGGSGGGAGGGGASPNGGAGTSGQGNRGGNNHGHTGGNRYGGSGGGGAGSQGEDSTNSLNRGTNGGSAVNNAFRTGGNITYSGGGAGGAPYGHAGGTPGAGGGSYGNAGADERGGGGGGASVVGVGGDGGDGIVVIRYAI